jgi:hypothetical protein
MGGQTASDMSLYARIDRPLGVTGDPFLMAPSLPRFYKISVLDGKLHAMKTQPNTYLLIKQPVMLCPTPYTPRATSDQIESKIQSDRIKLLAKIKAGAFSD